MIFQDVWFAKLLSRKGWANRLVDLVAVAALTFIEVDQLEVAGCGDLERQRNRSYMMMILDDSWWFLMLHSLVQKTSEANVVWYQIEVPTTFPDYLSTGSPFFWSDGKICRRPLCFMVKFPGFGMFPLIFVNTNSLINREQFPSQHPSFFFQGDSGESWPPLDAGGTGSML